MRCAGLVLAAGAGQRFGGPKAPVVIDGERLVDRAVRLLTEAGCAPVIVVLGAWVDEVPGATVVVNETWSEGMGGSLATGLRWLSEHSPEDAVLVTLVDLPGLTVEAVRAVLDEPAELVAATFDGARGHPVKFARRHWLDVMVRAHGDVGARDFLRGRGDLVLVEVGHLAVGVDLDTPPALPT